MTVADSDVLIDALGGREPARSTIAQAIETGALVTTAVTAFELLSGAGSDRVRLAIEDLLGALETLPVDADAARAAAAVRRELDALGTPIGMADYLTAGVCLTRSATLLTRNRTHFERVRGLKLQPIG